MNDSGSVVLIHSLKRFYKRILLSDNILQVLDSFPIPKITFGNNVVNERSVLFHFKRNLFILLGDSIERQFEPTYPSFLCQYVKEAGRPDIKRLLKLPTYWDGKRIQYLTFSPLGQYIYGLIDYGDSESIFRFAISTGSIQIIQTTNSGPGYFSNSMQTGIDGNIYSFSPRCAPNFVPNSCWTLSRIKCPDSDAPVFEDTIITWYPRTTFTLLPVFNQAIFQNAHLLQATADRDTICVGDSVRIQAYGAGANAFTWTLAGSPNVLAQTGIIKVAPAQTTTYRVRGQGCSEKDTTITIVVVPRVRAQIAASPAPPFCLGDTITLRNAALAAGGPTARNSWLLKPDSVFRPGRTYRVPIQNINPQTAILLAENGGCSATDTFRFSARPRLERPILSFEGDSIFCQGGSTQLRAIHNRGAALLPRWEDRKSVV